METTLSRRRFFEAVAVAAGSADRGHQERRTSVARVAVTETSTDIQLSTSTTRALRSLRPAAVGRERQRPA